MFLAALALGWTLAGGADEPIGGDRFLAACRRRRAERSRGDRRRWCSTRSRSSSAAGSSRSPIAATFVTSFDAFFTEEIKDLIAEAADAAARGEGDRRHRPRQRRAARDAGQRPLQDHRDRRRRRRLDKVRGARRGTTVVSFRTGESSAAFTGTLAAGEHERYVVKASRNELLEVRVDRVRGRDIVARVFDAATRTPVDARAQDGARSVDRTDSGDRRLPDRRGANGAARRGGADLLADDQRALSQRSDTEEPAMRWLDDAWPGRALRHPIAAAIAGLRGRSPSLTLALGIGATTAIYSVVDTILLQPLPFADSDRLVRVVENIPFIDAGRPPVAARPDLPGISRVAIARDGRCPTRLRSSGWRSGRRAPATAPRGCGAR